MKTPPIVSPQEWDAAREELLAEEKKLTRARDALAARRRRMPWMAVEKEYRFDGPDGPVSFPGLFEGRRQLIVYRAFYAPDVTTYPPGGGAYPERACVGCSFLADQVAHPAHLNARDTTLAFVSRAPQAEIHGLKERMGWELIPWYTITDDFDKTSAWTNGTEPTPSSATATGSTGPTSSTSAATKRWEAPGATWISRRSAARRSGRTRRRAIRRPHRTGGGTTTTRTARRRNRGPPVTA
jgi:predicted dithiol-disulfide oxidoreductase (DUF899 family)